LDFTRVTITTKKSNHTKKFGKLIFDDGTVNMVWGLKENGEKNVSVVNCNPNCLD